ncbi:MAG TPA: undecaprenyl-phosphate glucose phosphotransferase [Pseudomonadales bacterium]|nr:undecaprenyl-phosphate glucose phosphotransferase [Pseudomonadales bacterium]
MPFKSGFLSNHSRLFENLNRGLDVGMLGSSLWLCHLYYNADWGAASWITLLLALAYYRLSSMVTGLYTSQRSYSTIKHMVNVLTVVLLTFALLAITSAMSNTMHHLVGRPFLLRWLVVSATFLCICRLSMRQVLIWLRRRGYNIRRVAIAGCSAAAQALTERIIGSPWMGLVIDGHYDNRYGNPAAEPCENGPLKGDLHDLVESARSGVIDQVFIALPMQQSEEIRRLVNSLSDSAATVFIIPDVFTFELLNARQTSINGLPAISIYDSPFSVGDTLLKRGFDLVGSLAILTVIAVPMLAIACAVKLTSPGPAIFRQRRYGLDGKPIDVWKFRSMTVMDNGKKVKQATRDDARLTPIGGFLRRTSLDELPQFFNVIQGSMSIVGPRPHAIAHNEEYRKLIKGYMLRHKVKPGITGWAQINGWRGETDTLEKMKKRVEFDLDYIRNWNVWLDVKIVFLTIFKGFTNKNAY